MKARSGDYWRERAEKRMDEAVLKADSIADRIGTAYLEALRDIQKRLDSVFRNFSAGISEAEARRVLQSVKEPDVIKRLEKAVGRIEDAEKRALILAQINAPAYRARIDSLNTLADSVKSVCEKIGGKTLELMDSELSEIAESAYYRSIFDTQKGTGLGFSFALLSQDRINEILLTSWSGKHYSERIWDNSEKLAEAVQEILLNGFLTGKSSGRMASDLQKRMHSSYSRSLTLIRTEASYIANGAELESYRESGAEKYRFVATLDLRTSEICRSLDGNEYSLAEACQGENFPPMHPRCRSTTVPALSDEVMADMKRRAKDPVTGKPVTVPADMTYKEWYGRYVKGRAEAEANEKAVRNLSSDRKQFERYKRLLGKEMPRTLEEFQRIKYSDGNGYGVLKAQARKAAVDKSQKSGIIKAGEVRKLEQAKKRNHKIYITDMAIDKVNKVKLSDFSQKQIDDMQIKHKDLLKIAKEKNDSNEVLLINDLNLRSEVQIFGDEFVVSPAKNPFAVSVIGNAQRRSLIYMHNHPSTNNFSVADIDTFICEGAIKVMSVITNQGEVYILNKKSEYEYNKARNLMAEIFNSFNNEEMDNNEFVRRFLKQCHKGGIEYAKSK
ncbi:minor capsid protein [Ruminococcus sp. Marseille-P6503]|uniref:minor capsid protein n=1 Tax=Ruminococcus sp. Marseille-P6503 TaxID=2364796 RepID=UPI000F528CC0|nr:minor capsid protein [Ruminococcus sp. Marseille-P6503]